MFAALATATLDLLLPAVCPGCQVAQGPGLCAACAGALPILEHPCPWCAAPRRDAHATCRDCAGAGLAHLDRVLVGHPYAGLVAQLIGDAKAGSRPAALRALGACMPKVPAELLTAPQAVVVPVPPSPGRRPGAHLGSALANACARRAGLPCRALLRTTRLAAEQHLLGVTARAANVAGLFACRGPAPARVVLVDDLVTSGATATAAAKCLRAAGAHHVTLVCLARTPGHGDPVAAP